MLRRVLILILLASNLSLASTAVADETTRRVTTEAGAVHEGVIVRRGDGYILLKLADGRVIELERSEVELIEVIGAIEEDTAPLDERTQRSSGPSDATERIQPGVRLDELTVSELRMEDKEIEGHIALAIAPTVPLFSVGTILMFGTSLFSGPYSSSPAATGLFVMGATFTLVSVMTAAEGARLASLTVRMRSVSDRFVVGLTMAALGAGLLIVPMAAAALTASSAAYGSSLSTFNTFARPWFLGSGLGLIIAGTATLGSDAIESRRSIQERLHWSGRHARRHHTPDFVGAYLSPQPDGGVRGGVAFRW
jgi:hypothetical protein